jgi:hypothetical protein
VLEDKPVSPARGPNLKPFLAGLLTATILAAGYYFVLPRPAPSAATGAAGLASLVAEEHARIAIKPHTVVLTTDKAGTAAEALRRGDYRTADTLIEGIMAESRLEAFSFQPFDRFIDRLSLGNDPRLLDGLNSWVSHSQKSALAYLVRAKYFYNTAWVIRGSDFDSAVPPTHAQGFAENLNKAAEDVHQSMMLDSNVPWTYFLRLQISEVHDSQQDIEQAFQDGIARYPAYYSLYRTRLYYLEPKWGGSASLMYQFVDQYAGNAPSSSPLNLLYMQLTSNLLNAAWIDCRSLQHEALTRCMDNYLHRYVKGDVADSIAKALKLYRDCDPVQYSNALWPILGELEETQGETDSINMVLQLAAETMRSNNELIHESGHNSYVIDDITARLWAKLGNSVNVEQKFKEALDDAEAMSFANEDDRDVVLGNILDHMTWAARNANQYVKVIAYHEAADAVAGANRSGTLYNKCFAYYQLHQFQQAVDECTLVIDSHLDVLRPQYYRAWANEALKNYDAAIADYADIAENGSENAIRAGAVINMDHDNALQGKLANERAIFEKYPFVFDADIQSPEDLSIAYNNRCFVYMKMGELKKALDDCNTSLKYGRLPDALHKQQELLKQLNGKSI